MGVREGVWNEEMYNNNMLLMLIRVLHRIDF